MTGKDDGKPWRECRLKSSLYQSKGNVTEDTSVLFYSQRISLTVTDRGCCLPPYHLFPFRDTYSILFNFPIQVNFNISPPFFSEEKEAVRYTLSFCLVPSLSPLPLLSPCGNCWTGFLLYASYWHSSSHSSFLPLLPSTTSISLIFIFLLSFSPTYSVSPYHSPLTVIASPAVSHCVRALTVSVCVMAHFVCVHSCVYSVCVIFHGLAYSNF